MTGTTTKKDENKQRDRSDPQRVPVANKLSSGSSADKDGMQQIRVIVTSRYVDNEHWITTLSSPNYHNYYSGKTKAKKKKRARNTTTSFSGEISSISSRSIKKQQLTPSTAADKCPE